MTVVCDLQACNHHTEWGAYREEGVEGSHPPSRGLPAEHRKESQVRPLSPPTVQCYQKSTVGVEEHVPMPGASRK